MRADDYGFDTPAALAAHVEVTSCARGCTRALGATLERPAGDCAFLASAFSDRDVPFTAKGRGDARRVTCLRRIPIPRRVQTTPSQEGLF